jgi:hypothetical protein
MTTAWERRRLLYRAGQAQSPNCEIGRDNRSEWIYITKQFQLRKSSQFYSEWRASAPCFTLILLSLFDFLQTRVVWGMSDRFVCPEFSAPTERRLHMPSFANAKT